MNREEIIGFYRTTKYLNISLSVRGIPPRPREWNVPQFIKNVYDTNKDLFKTSISNNELVIRLDDEDLEYFRAVILHEALFDFYKAYYNYLGALKLYDGGLLHWINITSYYSKFFLASCVVTLAGKSRYIVRGTTNNFVPDIYNLISPRKYKSFLDENGKFDGKNAQYAIMLDICPITKTGKLKITTDIGRGGSHAYVWKKYAEVGAENFEITELTHYAAYPQHLSDSRNEENYTFDGYSQLDFNLDIDNFRAYFERDYIKNQSAMIYTSETAIILGVIGELFNLFSDFDINGLPLEQAKLIHMCKYSLGNNEQSVKLQDLINQGFPKENEYLKEYHWFENN